MLVRALRYGTAVFLALAGLAIAGVIATGWHRRDSVAATVAADRPHGVDAQQVHTDVVVAFSSSPLSLALGALIAWSVCVGVTCLALILRR